MQWRHFFLSIHKRGNKSDPKNINSLINAIFSHFQSNTTFDNKHFRKFSKIQNFIIPKTIFSQTKPTHTKFNIKIWQIELGIYMIFDRSYVQTAICFRFYKRIYVCEKPFTVIQSIQKRTKIGFILTTIGCVCFRFFPDLIKRGCGKCTHRCFDKNTQHFQFQTVTTYTTSNSFDNKKTKVALAHLAERLLCKQEAWGSIPQSYTFFLSGWVCGGLWGFVGDSQGFSGIVREPVRMCFPQTLLACSNLTLENLSTMLRLQNIHLIYWSQN